MTQTDHLVSSLLTDLYIGGKAVPAAAGGRFDVLDPATGAVIASVAPAAPFGGVKQSGIGREGGHDGVLDYTEQRYIAVSW